MRASALRFYESERLLQPAGRVGGVRVYGPEAPARLRMIAAAQRAGFTIREIRELVRGLEAGSAPAAAMHARAHRKLAELARAAAQIRAAQRLLRAMLACGCERIEDCAVLATASASRRRGAGRAARPGARWPGRGRRSRARPGGS